MVFYLYYFVVASRNVVHRDTSSRTRELSLLTHSFVLKSIRIAAGLNWTNLMGGGRRTDFFFVIVVNEYHHSSQPQLAFNLACVFFCLMCKISFRASNSVSKCWFKLLQLSFSISRIPKKKQANFTIILAVKLSLSRCLSIAGKSSNNSKSCRIWTHSLAAFSMLKHCRFDLYQLEKKN